MAVEESEKCESEDNAEELDFSYGVMIKEDVSVYLRVAQYDSKYFEVPFLFYVFICIVLALRLQ